MPSTTIEAGKLRQRIDIVKPNLTQDPAGGTQVDDDSIFATVWASIEAFTGVERYAGQQLVAEVTHKITIRWMDGVKASMNVWYEGRQFQIQAVLNPDERHHMLVLMCLERDDSVFEQGQSAP